MTDQTNKPAFAQPRSDPFEFAARLKLVLENTDQIRKLDLSEVQKLAEITRAAAGACGVGCGGC